MMNAETKTKVLEWFQDKSKGEKKKFYIKDVVKGLPQEDRHAIQDVVKELLDEGTLKYWSSGSTTYLMLAEYFPKEE
ncbi:MAG TPA: dissimilatory sulfite reductase D family protein [Thermodesulfobacteriota bacterium]|nr:dissimilatory sulfite reductase D family protein [Thermodesulfobacteriota bacterium]